MDRTRLSHQLYFTSTRRAALIAFFSGLLLALAGTVRGQQTWEKDGGIPNAEIEIVKDRQITLPPADRIFEKIPPRPAEPIRPEIVYQFRNLKFATPDFNPLLRPLKLKQEDLSKIYGNFSSMGYGNYNAPYLEAYANSKRDKNRFYGAHFYHQSYANGPVDNNNSGSGTTEVNLYGKIISNDVAVSGNLNYEDRATFFYGYPAGSDPKRESIRQHYQDINLGAGISNAKPADFNYALQGSYSYLSDHYKASEGELGLSLNSSYQFSEKARLLIKGDYFLMDHKDSVPGYKPRNLFRFKPAYYFKALEKLWLTVGANIALTNDTLGGQKPVHFYPHLRAEYQLGESVLAYAGITGDLDRVSLHTLSRENLWLNSNVTLSNTNRAAEFVSGLKGKVGGKVSFGVGLSLSTLKNLYFYQNDIVRRSKFNVVYDVGSVQRENIFAELGFHHGEGIKMVLRGDYYHYSTDRQPIAFHRPTYRVTFNSSYNLYSKIIFNVDLVAQGGMKAWDQSSKVVTIKPAADLNLKADYLVSKNVSVFLKFSNMLSNQYQMYLNYPVRGFQVMGGVSWSF